MSIIGRGARLRFREKEKERKRGKSQAIKSTIESNQMEN